MGITRQRVTTALGLALLVYSVGFFALTRLDAPLPAIAGTLVLACAGVLFVLPRIVAMVSSRALQRRAVDSIATILLAVGWMMASIPLATDSSAYGATVLAGGAALAFIGYQGLVGVPRLELPADQSTVQIVAGLLLVVVLVVTGFLVVSTT